MADSHVGETLPILPPEVERALAGVDLILHAGDLSQMAVLEQLGEIAPVIAVQGNHDRKGRLALPSSRRVAIAGATIGLAHGDRPRLRELPDAAASLLAGRPVVGGALDRLARHLGDCDCVCFGHLHLPILTRRRGVLLFSPGAVYMPEADPSADVGSLRARAVMRIRGALPVEARQPAVGILEIRRGVVRPRLVRLREPLRPVPAEGKVVGYHPPP